MSSFARLLRCRRLAALAPLLVLLLGGACATARVEPMIDANQTAFDAAINATLRVGMSIKEARAALLTQFPKPTLNSELVAAIPTNNRSLQNRRYLIGWPTTTRGTTLTVTLFCDRDRNIVRWTTGPLFDNS